MAGFSTVERFLPRAHWHAIAFACAFVACMASAATGQVERAKAASELNTDDPAVIARAYPFPRIDPVNELKGRALIDALRKGGYVLYMRHTQTGTITPECTASNLTPAGERDARNVGAALRAAEIPIRRLLSSPVCRVLDTARLLGLRDPEVTSDLSNVPPNPDADLAAARSRLVATPPPAGGNVLLVSHMQGGKQEQDRIYLDLGEIVVFRPDGGGAAVPTARIRVDDWADFIAATKP